MSDEYSLHHHHYRIVVRLGVHDLHAYKGDHLALHFHHLIGGSPEHRTPLGKHFRIKSIDRHHVNDINHTEMPYSCFFKSHVAFHEGDITQHSEDGCIHLLHSDAQRLFHWVRRHHHHHHQKIRVEIHH
jgi:hypothetical protein